MLEDETHSLWTKDIPVEYCWTGRSLSTLLKPLDAREASGKPKLRVNGRVALRIFGRVADVTERARACICYSLLVGTRTAAQRLPC